MLNWLLLLIAPLLALTSAKPTPPPSPLDCPEKCETFPLLMDCPHGHVKDTCNCRDVCLRKANELCGGPRNFNGVCDRGLDCVKVEDDGDDIMIPGVCKPKTQRAIPPPVILPSLCDTVRCSGKHKQCIIDENGQPTCVCKTDCTNQPALPFCGSDGIEYASLCEVEKKECELGKPFLYMPGKCQGCVGASGIYKHNELVRPGSEDKPCLEKICLNGRIEERLDLECLGDMGFDCTISSLIKSQNTQCQDGFSCLITKKSGTPGLYPHLGKCQTIEKDVCYHQGEKHGIGEKFVTANCRTQCTCIGWNKIQCVPLCPPQMMLCKNHEILVWNYEKVTDKCRCRKPTCKNAVEVCSMKPEPGACYAYNERWFYNPVEKKCQEFIWGGCDGNGNRFKTKALCERQCASRFSAILPRQTTSIGELKAAPVMRRRSRWPSRSKPPGQATYLTDTDLTIRGKVRFGGANRILEKTACLYITLADVSRMDVAWTIIKEQRFNVSSYDTSSQFEYVIDAKKPADDQLWRTFSLSARVHRNRCPEKQDNVNVGDFLTDTRHTVVLDASNNEYEKNIDMICYDCKKLDESKEVPEIEIKKIPAPPAADPEVKTPMKENEPTPTKKNDEISENESKIFLRKFGCKFENKTYQNGEIFVNQDCSGQCRCRADGTVACVTLCPPTIVTCRLGEVKVMSKIKHQVDARCTCEQETCVMNVTGLAEDECAIDGVRHKINEPFISKDCSGQCKCSSPFAVGCVSLCPPMMVDCGDNGRVEYVKVPVGDSGCSCDRPTCVADIAPPSKLVAFDEAPPPQEDVGDERRDEYTPGVVYNITLEQNKTMTIKGKVVFPNDLISASFPPSSCLDLTIHDASIADADGDLVHWSQKNVSTREMNNSTVMEYTLVTRKPAVKDLGRHYSLSATIHVGWCRGDVSNTWLQDGDFYTDYMNILQLSDDKDVYMNTINLTRYENNDGGFPETSYAPEVTLEKNRTMTLNGQIDFKKELGILPSPSCIKFKIEDVSIADASSFLLKSFLFNLSFVEVKDAYKFSLTAPKPVEEDLHDQFAISSTLHVGWCPSDRRTRPGDHFTDTIFNVALNAKTDVYEGIRMHLKENEPMEEPKVVSKLTGNDDADNDDEEKPEEIPDDMKCINSLTNQVKKDGDQWNEGPCSDCQCDGGRKYCAMMDCAMLDCDSKYVVQNPDECCPKCVVPPPTLPPAPTTCFVKETNTTYAHGATWKVNDCMSCMCDQGFAACAIQDCFNEPLCEKPVKKPGKCCPVCEKPTCYDKGKNRTYNEMEMWVRSDGCTRCMCMGGYPMCATPGCAIPKCDPGIKHVNVPGICCPVCENTKICMNDDGGKSVAGDVWHKDDKQCDVCRCTKDGIRCSDVDRETDADECNADTGGRVVQLSRECGRFCLRDEKQDKKKEESEESRPKEDEEEAPPPQGEKDEDVIPPEP